MALRGGAERAGSLAPWLRRAKVSPGEATLSPDSGRGAETYREIETVPSFETDQVSPTAR